MLAGSISHPRNPSKKFFGPFRTQEMLQKRFLSHFAPKKSAKKVFWTISHPRNTPKKFFEPFHTQEMRQKSFLGHFAPVKCATPGWLPQLRQGKHVEYGSSTCSCPANGRMGVGAAKLHLYLPQKEPSGCQNLLSSSYYGAYPPKTCRRTCFYLTFDNIY